MADGIINVYKEKGYTSHDVVAKMRGILKQKKSDIPVRWTPMRRGCSRSVLETAQSSAIC